MASTRPGVTLELGYGTHTSAGRALPWLIRQEWSSWEETPLQSSTAKNGRDPSSHPSHTVPLIPQVRGLGPPKEKLKEPVTLSVIFPSEEPISGAVRLLPTPTQALLLLQDPLGNTRLLPTGLPVPPHPDTSPRHPCRDRARVELTLQLGPSAWLRAALLRARREGTGARVQHHEKWVLILSL